MLSIVLNIWFCFWCWLSVGKVVRPDESAEKFMSVIGELDQRLKLDASISKDDARYNPSLSMMAAKLCYENKDFVKSAIEDQLKVI